MAPLWSPFPPRPVPSQQMVFMSAGVRQAVFCHLNFSDSDWSGNDRKSPFHRENTTPDWRLKWRCGPWHVGVQLVLTLRPVDGGYRNDNILSLWSLFPLCWTSAPLHSPFLSSSSLLLRFTVRCKGWSKPVQDLAREGEGGGLESSKCFHLTSEFQYYKKSQLSKGCTARGRRPAFKPEVCCDLAALCFTASVTLMFPFPNTLKTQSWGTQTHIFIHSAIQDYCLSF